MNKKIKLLISDFDGTLVDTFYANYAAYQEAFINCGLKLTYEQYKEHFGYRFDQFMKNIGINDIEICNKIKEVKKNVYGNYFNLLNVNTSLLEFIKSFKLSGGKTAIASTASKNNLLNVLNYIGATDYFDLIIGGEDVNKGKPDPEIYLKIIKSFNINSDEALVFEDSLIGMEAAQNAGISFIQINKMFYGNRS